MKEVRGTHFAIASALLILFAACGGGSADAPNARSDDLSAGAGPDVVVTLLDYVHGVFTCKVKNRGSRPTSSGISIGVRYLVDGVSRTWGGVKGPLAAGASVTIGTDGGAYTIPNGTHTITAYVDDVNRFEESDDTNNQFSKSVTIGDGTASCPSGSINFADHGGVSDHVGISFGGCSGTGLSKDCVYTQPVTCSTKAGTNRYTISGYTPSNADIGKHLVIGMPYKINGSMSFTGAGGSKYLGQPLRVRVQSVSGQILTGTTLSRQAGTNFEDGSTSANAVNTVTNAECDLETDNGPALQSIVNGGSDVCIPPGSWGFDSSVQITTNNRHIHCLPGAVLYDARNDAYLGQGLPGRGGGAGFFGRMLFSWQGVSGGGMDGCTYVGTNTGVYWNMDVPGAGNGKQPDANVAIFTNNSTRLRFENLVGLNIWANTFVLLSGNENYPVAGVKGTNDTVVTNVFTKNVWAYGAAIIFGHGNTFSNLVMRNSGPDIEPNNAAQADLTYGNTFTNIQSVIDDKPTNGATIDWSSRGGPFCQASATCNNGQTVTNSTIKGSFHVFPACASGTIGGKWSGITLLSNETGNPTCFCGNHC